MKVSGIYIAYSKTGKHKLKYTGTLLFDFKDGSYKVRTAWSKGLLIETYCGDTLNEN